MTKSESVQKAYNWAFEVRKDKKSPCMTILGANAVLDTMKHHDSFEDAYEPIVSLLREWTASGRESQKSLGKLLARMMKVDLETVEA